MVHVHSHKDIGILYLIISAFVGLISVAFTVYMRLELMDPGVQYMCLSELGEPAARLVSGGTDCYAPNGHLWNVLVTGHGILMMFFVVIPAPFWWFWKLFHAVANQRARYGISAYEQSFTLAMLQEQHWRCSVLSPGGNGPDPVLIGCFTHLFLLCGNVYGRSSRFMFLVPLQFLGRSI